MRSDCKNRDKARVVWFWLGAATTAPRPYFRKVRSLYFLLNQVEANAETGRGTIY